MVILSGLCVCNDTDADNEDTIVLISSLMLTGVRTVGNKIRKRRGKEERKRRWKIWWGGRCAKSENIYHPHFLFPSLLCTTRSFHQDVRPEEGVQGAITDDRKLAHRNQEAIKNVEQKKNQTWWQKRRWWSQGRSGRWTRDVHILIVTTFLSMSYLWYWWCS